DLETTMEDTHVWVMNADGSARRELGGKIDNRQFNAGWSPDGASVYFIVQQRGSTHLVRMPVAGGSPEFVVKDLGNVGPWTAAAGGKLAYTFRSPSDLGQIYLRTGSGAAKKLTDLNSSVLAGKQIAPVESFTFVSNDNKYEVEAFLTKPLGMTPTSTH